MEAVLGVTSQRLREGLPRAQWKLPFLITNELCTLFPVVPSPLTLMDRPVEPRPGANLSLRARAILHLPSEYKFVSLEIQAQGTTWTSPCVAVAGGGWSMLEYWVRIPGFDSGYVHFRVSSYSLIMRNTVAWHSMLISRCGAAGKGSLYCLHCMGHDVRDGHMHSMSQVTPEGATGTFGILNRVKARSLFTTLHIENISARPAAYLGASTEHDKEAGVQEWEDSGNRKRSGFLWHQATLPLTATSPVARFVRMDWNLPGRLKSSVGGSFQSVPIKETQSHSCCASGRQPVGYVSGGPASPSCGPASPPADGPSGVKGSSLSIPSPEVESHPPPSGIEPSSLHPTVGPGFPDPSDGLLPSIAAQDGVRMPLSTSRLCIGGIMAKGRESEVVPEACGGPVLLVEHCSSFLPMDLARLPELDLREGLHRSLHCYAHGGFMGAAISMLADPDWEHILLESIKETGKGDVVVKVNDRFVYHAVGVHATSRILM